MFNPLDLADDRRVTIAGRELSALSREKTIVLALVIQLFIAAFSSFLVVGLTSLYDPSSTGGEIEVAVSGEQQDRLLDAIRASDSVSASVYENRAAALAAFENREVNAVVTARAESTDQGNRIAIDATVPSESLETTLIVVTLRELLSDLEQTEREARGAYLEFTPVEIAERPPEAGDDFTQYFSFTYTILIPLLLFLPPFISGSVVVDSVTEEIERGTLELLRVAPVSLTDIVDGKALGMILLAPLQAILWIALLQFNDISIAYVPILILFVLAVATITTGIGLALGVITGTRQKAQLLYSLVVLLLFGAAAVLPEHPAQTAALLAVDSPTVTTFAHVTGYTVAAIVGYAAVRWYVGRLDPESI